MTELNRSANLGRVKMVVTNCASVHGHVVMQVENYRIIKYSEAGYTLINVKTGGLKTILKKHVTSMSGGSAVKLMGGHFEVAHYII